MRVALPEVLAHVEVLLDGEHLDRLARRDGAVERDERLLPAGVELERIPRKAGLIAEEVVRRELGEGLEQAVDVGAAREGQAAFPGGDGSLGDFGEPGKLLLREPFVDPDGVDVVADIIVHGVFVSS